jgi:holo-[acyl-carrier protein] synthase
MQIIAHGIDLVDCDRIEQMLTRHETRFLKRVFTPKEQAYCAAAKNRVERFAGRFAAKEAVLKLIGMGWREKIAWTDVEVVNDPKGKPEVHLSGQVQDIAEQMGIEQVSLSITHAANLAVASAVALGTSP